MVVVPDVGFLEPMREVKNLSMKEGKCAWKSKEERESAMCDCELGGWSKRFGG
jgi:hypothetical protein